MAEASKKFEIDVTPFKMFLPILMAKVPQFVKLGGKRIDIHALINGIVADNKISAEDIGTLLAAYLSAEAAPVAPPAPPVVVVPTPTPVTVPPPVGAHPTQPTTPGRVFVDEVELKVVAVVDRARSGEPAKDIPFTIDADGNIKREDGTEALDDRSTIWFDSGASAQGAGIRIDKDPARTPPGEVNHPELLGMMIFRAWDNATGKLVASIGGKGLEGDMGHYEDGASFVPNRYWESGGMAANLRIKDKFELGLRVQASLQGQDSNQFNTMPIR